MWTPKRILILAGGVIIFLALFAVYNRILGDIDGLPELPIVYLPAPVLTEPKPPPPPPSDGKFLEAFGTEKGCPELGRDIRLWLADRGLGLSSEKFEIEPDGRVKLTPFSVCIYPKNRTEGKFPEINIVRCEIALLTLDHPVRNLAELGSRKIIGIELRGDEGVKFENNRGTKEKIDDLEVLVKNAPVFYDESRRLAWSDGLVEVVDRQSRPNATRVVATGFELQLAPEESKKKPNGAGKGKGEGVSGVESIVLLSNVDMQLWVDPRSGFLADPHAKDGAPKETGGGKKANEPAEKAHLTIQTPGKFRYDLVKEQAHFFGPKNGSEFVVVTREHKLPGGVTHDEIKCDDLEMQFRKKPRDPSAASKPGGDGAMEKEIESALATAIDGKKVTLTMESENLVAWGASMSYVCAGDSMGPRSVIKGQPMRAIKDGHNIFSPELQLIGADKNGRGQQGIARGPGLIELFDKTNNTSHQHAVWSDNLIWAKVREGEKRDGDKMIDKMVDLLVLTGDASFVDEEQKQAINGQKLQVWMEPGGPAANDGGPAMQQKPYRVEATGNGNVSAISQDMNLRGADIFIIHIKDGAPKKLPEPQAGTEPVPVSQTAANDRAPADGKTSEPARTSADRKISTDGNDSAAKEKNPINLEAKKVIAYAVRVGTQTQLQELIAHDKVHVIQKGKTDKDKGVDIQGDVLNLLHFGPQSDILYVYGDARKLALLQMDETIISGPKVTINQKENVADVEGRGWMRMPSNTAMDGSKASKPGSILTINWTSGMVFDGRHADFTGGVTADQDNSRLTCVNLQVTLDKAVSFKEGQSGGQNAKVEKMVCDRKVTVLDQTRDLQKRLTKQSTGSFTQLTMDNQVGNILGSGPGEVTAWDRSSAQVDAKPGSAKAPTQPGDKMTLTRVEFKGRMFSHQADKETTRLTKFYGDVEVYHHPTNDPNARFNRDAPPKDGLYLNSSLLKILTRQVAGKSTQVMEAEDKVTFRTDEFFGRADKLVYDEQADTIVFIANEGNNVVIHQTVKNKEEFTGRRILYIRHTGEFKMEGVNGLTGN